MQSRFKEGDIVTVVTEETIEYTIACVYGNGAHAICNYSAKGITQELSIPTIALRRVPAKTIIGRRNQLLPARYAGGFGR